MLGAAVHDLGCVKTSVREERAELSSLLSSPDSGPSRRSPRCRSVVAIGSTASGLIGSAAFDPQCTSGVSFRKTRADAAAAVLAGENRLAGFVEGSFRRDDDAADRAGLWARESSTGLARKATRCLALTEFLAASQNWLAARLRSLKVALLEQNDNLSGSCADNRRENSPTVLCSDSSCGRLA